MIHGGYCGKQMYSCHSDLDEWQARLVHMVSADVRSFVQAAVISALLRFWLIINTTTPNLGEYLEVRISS